jgi:dipeptidyl aminopeptidase/acylaminoacyl peptidase
MLDSTRIRATAFAIVTLSVVQLACAAAGDTTPSVTNPPPPPPPSLPTTGTLVVILQPKGNGRDADAFSALLDGTLVHMLTPDSSVTFESLSPGNHTVHIGDMAPQCSATTDSITHTTKVGVTDTVTIGATCLGGFAYEHAVDSTTTQLAYLAEDGRTIDLTTGPGFKYIGPWSPDGTRLLYAQTANNHFHLYSVGADGTDTRTLTSGSDSEFGAQWSPDGAHIAYVKRDSTGDHAVIADADGANAHPLAGMSPKDFDLTWSADGSRLYFGCDRFGRVSDVCTAALDGSDLRAIRYAALEPIVTPCSPVCNGMVMQFAASPDGRTIAFREFTFDGIVPFDRIWTASVDGTGAIPLSGNTESFEGHWSPTGDRMLLLITDNLARLALATVKPDGTSYQQIVSYADSIVGGAWSPDGKVILYTDLKTFQLGAMNADGSNRRLITRGARKLGWPAWNPKARAVGVLSADRARPSSPHVEQLPVLSWLRPEVLRRSLHPRP